MLCRLGAATSSVKKKQKYLNRVNCRDERLMLNKLLENRLTIYLLTVLHAHIIAAAKEQDTDDCLVCAKKIVEQFVKVQLSSQVPVINCNDMSYNYATNLLTLGLVWHGYHDAIKEGDGNTILLY